MKAFLFAKTGDFSGKKFAISTHATIGKTAENIIEIAAATISKKHARIFFDDEAQVFFIEDLGSKNGTAIDGVRVYEKEKLGKLHVISFAGVYDFIFHIPEKQPMGHTTDQADASVTVAEQQTVFDSGEFVAPDLPTVHSKADPKETQFGDTFEA